jgi:tetratricopeptide (TPR) repeat protein
MGDTHENEAGADVWYDEHNLGSGQLMEVIQRELGRHPVVVVILSKADFASTWVRREVTWAYHLLARDSSRLILPVTGGPIDLHDFDPAQGWLFLEDFKRIEAAGMQPYPCEQAISRLLHVFESMLPDERHVSTYAQESIETAEELVHQGCELKWQDRNADALLLFQRATQLAPNSGDAWYELGLTLSALERHEEALSAFDKALELEFDFNPSPSLTCQAMGRALKALGRDQEAEEAFDSAFYYYQEAQAEGR